MIYKKYFSPKSLGEAISLLNMNDGSVVKPIAWAIDLMLQLYKEITKADILVDHHDPNSTSNS